MRKGKVLIAAPVHPVLINGLKELGYDCLVEETITQSSAPKLIYGCIGVITSTRLLLNKELLDCAPGLKWIGRMGSGMEIIDLAYAKQRDIVCFSSPEGNCNAVGEHALGMLLSLIRNIGWSQQEIINGLWLREENRGIELEGKTIGIIGYGNTGKSFAKKLQGFDVNLLIYDKYSHEKGQLPITWCHSLAPIFELADIVSFHIPLTADTLHWFNNDFVRYMRKPFILINTSRGQVVDSNALQAGINSDKIIGACIDVWEEEPMAKMSNGQKAIMLDLAKKRNVIITPHIAGYTHEALFKMSRVLLNKIIEHAGIYL